MNQSQACLGEALSLTHPIRVHANFFAQKAVILISSDRPERINIRDLFWGKM